MRPAGSARVLALFLVIGSALGALGWLWWSSVRGDTISFLPRRASVEWIVYPTGGDPTTWPEVELATEFKRSFAVDKLPPQAVLRAAGFRRCSISINGVQLGEVLRSGRNWKEPSEFEVARLLRTGENELRVAVLNSNGPPVLWLSLEAGDVTVVSDESWQCSYADAVWHPAQPAGKARTLPVGSPMLASEAPWVCLRARWPLLLLFAGLSAALSWLLGLWDGRGTDPDQGSAATEIAGSRGLRACLKIVGADVRRLKFHWVSGTNHGLLTSAPTIFRHALTQVWAWLRRRDLLLPAGLAAVWAVLFANNIGGLPVLMGYDADSHLAYVQYIVVNHALPLAAQGWEMFQPPLYYLLSAGLLGVLGLPVMSSGGAAALELLGLGIGVAHWLIVWASLRLLFPGGRSQQLAGLLLAACLPALLYISQYITNEGLCAALVSASLYLALRIVSRPQASWRAYAGLGACLGAALLAKYTAIIAVPVIVAGIVWKRVQSPKSEVRSPKSEVRSPKTTVPGSESVGQSSETAVQSGDLKEAERGGATSESSSYSVPRLFSRTRTGTNVRSFFAAGGKPAHWAAGLAVMLGVCVAVCGWHYARVWASYGTPLMVNWDPRAGFTWWQDDGYRTSAYYLKFGAALRLPWFSSLQSFWDSIYSTLWGDAMLGGNARRLTLPPWNYDLMAAGYWLALAPSLALLAGGVVMVLSFIRRPSAQGFMVLGLGFLAGFALLEMSLVVPGYGAAKAFYGLAGLVPLCAAGAAGFEAMAFRSKRVRAVLATLFGLWAVNSCASYWVLCSSAPSRIVCARSLATQGRLPEALERLKRLVAEEPQNLDARSLLIIGLLESGEVEEVARQTEVLGRGDPANAEAQLTLSTVASVRGRMDAAIAHARRAVELAPWDFSAYAQLADSLAGAGRYAETAEVSRRGFAVAPFNATLRLAFGCALLAAGDTNAAAQLALAARLGPDSPQSHGMIGAALAQAGRLEEAAAELRRALGGDINNPRFHQQLGSVLARQGQFAEAVAQYSEALRSNPDGAEALNGLAWIRAAAPDPELRDGAEAVRLAERACRASGYKQPALLQTLAAAYAEAGRFDEAVKTARQAREAGLAEGENDGVKTADKLIELFTQRKPFRDLDANR